MEAVKPAGTDEPRIAKLFEKKVGLTAGLAYATEDVAEKWGPLAALRARRIPDIDPADAKGPTKGRH